MYVRRVEAIQPIKVTIKMCSVLFLLRLSNVKVQSAIQYRHAVIRFFRKYITKITSILIILTIKGITNSSELKLIILL